MDRDIALLEIYETLLSLDPPSSMLNIKQDYKCDYIRLMLYNSTVVDMFDSIQRNPQHNFQNVVNIIYDNRFNKEYIRRYIKQLYMLSTYRFST